MVNTKGKARVVPLALFFEDGLLRVAMFTLPVQIYKVLPVNQAPCTIRHA